MSDKSQFDICIIGAGSAGLSVAASAVQMGLRIALVENHKMGGDCLNYGCVPSKSLIAAAKRFAGLKNLSEFGIEVNDASVDFKRVHQHVREVIATIEPHDSVERFEGLGVDVFRSECHFSGPNTLIIDGKKIKSRYFVVATGSRARVPPISGLDNVTYYTNHNIFDLTEQPKHLIVIGGGPIGCELAQAYAMLGTSVTLLEAFNILPKDDPEAVAVVREQMIAHGVVLKMGMKIDSVSQQGNEIVVKTDEGVVSGSHLLVATGRQPNVEQLQLEKADVDYNQKGIAVNKRLRSSNKRVFAAGDVAGSYQFTHAAGYHASMIIKNVVFHMPYKVDYSAMPWVTYTSPELAHVGLNEMMAKQQKIKHKVFKLSFSEIDRNQAERQTEGFIKIVVSNKALVLGATIVGADAGELILPWCLAISQGLKVSALAEAIVPYPTRSDISKRVAGSYYTEMLFSESTQKIVKRLMRFLG
ncbi:MAG: FAD-dependent oxidoreductase [Gammaproteobacteria bacterium]|nr:FAD-dependent oxidoreductase [Gammaproteobacteria bacterium]